MPEHCYLKFENRGCPCSLWDLLDIARCENYERTY
jgi:hypothetical protein